MSEHAENLEVLAHVPTEAEAAMIVSVLKGEGIDAVAQGGLTSAFRAEVPGEVRVVVHRADLEQAKRVLAEYRKGVAGIDWSEVDVGEPE